MRKLIAVLLFLLLFTTACAPSAPSSATPSSNPRVADASLTAFPVDETGILPTATQAPPTATPSLTPTPAPTLKPSPTATPAPVIFDQDGYRQFAIIRSYFAGFFDFTGDRNWSDIGYAFSPMGDRIALAGCWGSMTNTGRCESADSGFLVVLDTQTGALVTEIPLGQGWPGGMAFTADGQSLLYSTTEHRVALWNLANDSPDLTLFSQPASGSPRYPAVAAAPDGRSFAAVVRQTFYAWDPSGEILYQSPADRSYSAYGAVAYSAGGTRLVVIASDRASVEVFDTTDWTVVRRLQLAEIQDAAISPDGRVLSAVESANDTAVVWDIQTGERLAELDPGHWADHVEFNPTGDLLVIAGMGNLDSRDGYSNIGTVYETQTWSRLDGLYSFSGDGQVEFSSDGSRMAVLGSASLTIWGSPDEQLLAGFEAVKEFQAALHTGDYAAAAALFEVAEQEVEYLADMGVDPADLAGSFERLCASQVMFCYPVQELVMMGYDWDNLTYLVRLRDPEGGTFLSPKGARIIYFYLKSGADAQPRLIYLPQE